jgi:hypothetical protein
MSGGGAVFFIDLEQIFSQHRNSTYSNQVGKGLIPYAGDF